MNRAKEQARNIQVLLGRRLRRAGVTRIERARGKYPGYYRDRRRRGLSVEELLETLAALEVEPAGFFSEALESGIPDPVARLKRETSALGPAPPLVTRVEELLLREGDRRTTAADRGVIERLDAMRYRDPRRAERQARRALQLLADGLQDRSLGVGLLAVWASSQRMLQQLEPAQQALMAALEVARAWRDRRAEADALQRLSYVVGTPGRYPLALELVDRALISFAVAGDPAGIGRCLVDRGRWLHYLGRAEEAVEAYRSALTLLPSKEAQYRFSANLCLAICAKDRGELRPARRSLARAKELAAGIGPLLLGKLTWLEAQLANEEGAYDLAEEAYRETIEIFHTTSSVDAALASTELLRILLIQNRGPEAHELAKAMTSLVAPLEKYPVAAAALSELLCCVYAGRKLTVKLVEEALKKLEEGGRPERHTPC